MRYEDKYKSCKRCLSPFFYQNAGNGIINSKSDAISGAITTTHKKEDRDVSVTVNYNPSRGAIADLIESAQDKFRNEPTPMAKIQGEFMKNLTEQEGGANYVPHSQNNLLTGKGIEYIKNNGRFLEDAQTVTVTGIGSPLNKNDMENAVKDTPIQFNKNLTNEGDLVGEILGRNQGDNQQLERIKSINIKAHSTDNYPCDESKGMICGDNK